MRVIFCLVATLLSGAVGPVRAAEDLFKVDPVAKDCDDEGPIDYPATRRGLRTAVPDADVEAVDPCCEDYDGPTERRLQYGDGLFLHNDPAVGPVTVRPESAPPATKVVNNGGFAKIDAICPLAGCPGTGACCVLKVCDGCTAELVGGKYSITCKNAVSRLCQRCRGGMKKQWW